MTAAYSATPYAGSCSLATLRTSPRSQAQEPTKTGQRRPAFSAEGRSKEQEHGWRALFSDVVTRAVCAARVLTTHPPREVNRTRWG